MKGYLRLLAALLFVSVQTAAVAGTIYGPGGSKWSGSFSSSRGGGGRGSGGSDSARLPDPREIKRRQIMAEAIAARARQDYRAALQLVWEALALRDDADDRELARKLQAAVMVEDGNALEQSGNRRGALNLYNRALALWPDAFDDENRRGLAIIEASVRRAEENDAELRREEAERQRLLLAAQNANYEALQAIQQGKWAEALARFRQLPRLPDDPKINANWALAEAGVALTNGKLDQAIAKLQNALVFDATNPRAEQMLKTALDERTRQAKAIQDSIAVQNELSDPRVVDARGPKPGAELIASIPELANSPAGERARKGLMAAAAHDWPVALAWYQDALLHDPNNAALMRAVDLARWMVDARNRAPSNPAAPRVAPPPVSGSGSSQSDLATLSRTLFEYAEQLEAQAARELAAGRTARSEDIRRGASDVRKQAVEALMFSSPVTDGRSSNMGQSQLEFIGK